MDLNLFSGGEIGRFYPCSPRLAAAHRRGAPGKLPLISLTRKCAAVLPVLVFSFAKRRLQADIPHAFVSAAPLPVADCCYIPDACAAICAAVQAGDIRLQRYEAMGAGQHAWLRRIIRADWQTAEAHPDYRLFLSAKFPDILQDLL